VTGTRKAGLSSVSLAKKVLDLGEIRVHSKTSSSDSPFAREHKLPENRTSIGASYSANSRGRRARKQLFQRLFRRSFKLVDLCEPASSHDASRVEKKGTEECRRRQIRPGPFLKAQLSVSPFFLPTLLPLTSKLYTPSYSHSSCIAPRRSESPTLKGLPRLPATPQPRLFAYSLGSLSPAFPLNPPLSLIPPQ